MNGLLETVTENLVFVLQFLGLVALMFVVAILIHKAAEKKRGQKKKILDIHSMTIIGMLSAIATILHLFDFSLPFLAPVFYKVDFSEIAVMVGTFSLGPVAGVLIEFCKILLKVLIKGTSTAFVGDLANFLIGCSLLLPASAVYEFTKTKKGALLGCIAGTVVMTVFGSMFNGLYLIPKFVVMYGMPSVDTIVAMGSKINPAITDLKTLVCFSVAPLNLLKASVVSVVTMVIYKPLRRVMK